MLKTERGKVIIADAWEHYKDAIEMLERGDLRNAAGKGWGAIRRATNALVLERTGQEPEEVRETSAAMRRLAWEDATLASLKRRYTAGVAFLLGDCFYDGHCAPEDYHSELIRDTADYIRDVETLASDGD